MHRALITGISGQDGTYLAQSLLAAGVEVHGIVRSSAVHDDTPLQHPLLTVHQLDLTNGEALAGLIRRVRPDEIYNLAAMSSVMQSWLTPVPAALVNAMPIVSILDTVWKIREEQGTSTRVVQASSAELFGQATSSPQSESTPIAPTSPYGAAKAFGHHMVGVYRALGVHASSCILFNHESPLRPETFVTRKITAGVARISRGRQTSLELGNLAARRDWGWAPDYVNAMTLAAAAERGDDYVIASGVTHSVHDFVDTAFRHVGIDDWRPLVTSNPAFSRPSDPVEQRGDASKARSVLGWAPTRTFEQIVAAMVDADLALLDAPPSNPDGK